MKDSDKIKKYIELLLSWNKTHNLISKNQTNNINEHIEDSLSVLEHLGDVLVDLGVDDSAVVAERAQARATLAAARTQMAEEAA